jgi:hypothetical protein
MRYSKIALGLFAGLALSVTATVQASEIERALLISVDGLHALDVQRYVESHPNSALAELSKHGTTFTNARTPANSDSFPGLLALVTGGSPVSHGVFYDVSYDRTLFAPGSNCVAGPANGPGSSTTFDESIDAYDTTDPNNWVSKNVIDPSMLPQRLVGNNCVQVYPHDAIKTNTIFEVVKASGGHTAWADKHAAYDLVNGPSGKGVDDLYTPEITNVNGFDNTVSVHCTAENDKLKVDAIVNEIKGFSADGKSVKPVPTVFGMNFQAVSVGQKLVVDSKDGTCGGPAFNSTAGGYLDGAGTPTEVLAYGLKRTDDALARIISTLKDQHKYESTLIILSAKHGQSPINPVKVNKATHFADLVGSLTVDPADAATQQIIVDAGNCGTGPCGFISDDDIALIWLPDQSKTNVVTDFINRHAKELFVDEVMAGNELKLKFNDPATDARTPDIIVQPQYGTIYTKPSKNKNAEHGGFSFGDTNVGLIVSNPSFSARVVKTPVASSQVAPTILQALGLDPNALNSVRVEHTKVLPGIAR